MCNPASMVLTEQNVYWSTRTDSHCEIMVENNLTRDNLSGKILLALVEITPPNDNMFAPPSEWRFKLDMDRAPHWFNPDREEQRVRTTLNDWLAARVFAGQKNVEIRDAVVWLNNSSAVLYSNSSAVLYSNSSAELLDNSRAKLYNNSSITTYKIHQVEIHGEGVEILRENGMAPQIFVAKEN
jgi:hypothetical protein